VRKPAILWTPWGPMSKDGKSPLQVKSRWLPNVAVPRPDASGRRREN